MKLIRINKSGLWEHKQEYEIPMYENITVIETLYSDHNEYKVLQSGTEIEEDEVDEYIYFWHRLVEFVEDQMEDFLR